MSKFNQKEGVFNAVCAVTEQESFDGAVTLTKEQRASVISIVTEGLVSGDIDMTAAAREKHNDEAKMRTYTNGLVSNWLKKDLRLNGNEPHKPKNPGSRAGSSDAVIKNLKALKSTLSNPEQIAAVDAEIDKRLATLKAEKTKTVEIDINLIPEDLRDLVNG